MLCFLVASCSVNDVGGKLGGTSSTRDANLAIFADFKIPGDRTVIGWEVRTTAGGTVSLGIFRNDSETSYTVVGTSTVDAPAEGHHILDLEGAAQITTLAGDVIGLIYSNIVPVGEGGAVAEEYKSRVFGGSDSSLSKGTTVTVTVPPETTKQTIAVRAILEPLPGECQRSKGHSGGVAWAFFLRMYINFNPVMHT